SNRLDVFNLIGYFAVGSAISFLGRLPGRAPSSTTEGRGVPKRRVVRQRAIELRKASNADAALAVVRSGQEEQSQAELLSALNAVIEEEHRLLAERTAQAAVEDSRERWVLGL